jgi:DNA-directed RNA polymerase subunit M/transcription elongation factor TFIIS
MARNEEYDKAVKAVDKMEDDAVVTDESEDIIACPKCKRMVTDGDYIDQFANTMEDSNITKITCPQCGYSGMPIELSIKDYKTWLEAV